jgi:nicotinate phosphoribosyltransferase
VALSDTWGANFFFEDFAGEMAGLWNGLRHDSGDPFEWGEKAIAFYEKLGIDPRGKTLLFSDGLEVEKIVSLYDRFAGRAKVAFGWGTNLTNDVGFLATSLVMKLFEVEGVSTVKLSDNLAKAMGPKEDVERYARVFGHSGSALTECKY